MILAVPDPLPADHSPAFEQAPDAGLLAAFYPRLAQSARIGGQVRMQCLVKASGTLDACKILDETPTGYGFGKATLEAAGVFRMTPQVRAGHVVDGASVIIPINWAPPPLPSPDVPAASLAESVAKGLADPIAGAPPLHAPPSTPAGVSLTSERPPPFVQAPEWTQLPSGDDMADFYPEAAQRAGVGGVVKMQCTVHADGLLAACAILSEDPPAFGFGEATLKLSARFRMKPKTTLSGPVEGEVIVPVRWAMPEPTEFDGMLQAMQAKGEGMFVRPLVWDQKPGEAQIAAAYPARARARGLAGQAELICQVAVDGSLQDCRADAQPDGFGFDDAALKLAAAYRAATVTPDGDRTVGAIAMLPIVFRLQSAVPQTPSRSSPQP